MDWIQKKTVRYLKFHRPIAGSCSIGCATRCAGAWKLIGLRKTTGQLKMKYWMFNCNTVSRLISESFDREMPLFQKIGLRIHFLMCRICSRYAAQLKILRETVCLYATPQKDDGPPVPLPPQAKDRIKSSISKHKNHLA